MDLPPPDPTLHNVGGGNRGPRQLATLRRFGLTPTSSVLEVGCGTGKLTYELASFLSEEGHYVGVDVAPPVIDWLSDNYGSKLPNFEFVLLDARGTKYNRKGSVDPSNVRLPAADASFDVACAFAVFMHMSLDGIRNYLSELRRVLRPGGSLLVTFNAIWEDEDEPEHRGRRYVNLGDGLYTRQPDKENASMGHHVTLIRRLLAEAGLETLEELRGMWHATGVSANSHGSDLFALRRP